jgi:PAS domain S-box-containing protein
VTKLRESENQLRLITDNAPVAIVHLDSELRYKFLNRYHADRLMERFGFTREQVVGKRVLEMLLPFQPGQPQFIHCRFEPPSPGPRLVFRHAA